jgi:hypothetical protein
MASEPRTTPPTNLQHFNRLLSAFVESDEGMPVARARHAPRSYPRARTASKRAARTTPSRLPSKASPTSHGASTFRWHMSADHFRLFALSLLSTRCRRAITTKSTALLPNGSGSVRRRFRACRFPTRWRRNFTPVPIPTVAPGSGETIRSVTSSTFGYWNRSSQFMAIATSGLLSLKPSIGGRSTRGRQRLYRPITGRGTTSLC